MSSSTTSNLEPFAVRNALLVAADADLNALLSSVLESGSWAIHHVPDNCTALKAAREKAFDLILTSEKTTGWEDVDLLCNIRRIRPHTHLIILTNDSTPADVIASMRARAFSYFASPYSTEELANMIRNAVDGPCWDDGIEIIGATPELIQVLYAATLRPLNASCNFSTRLQICRNANALRLPSLFARCS